MKTANTPHENLSANLRILANRRNNEDLKFSAAIPRQALRKITADTCELPTGFCEMNGAKTASQKYLYQILDENGT
jgi:hypothetical protein